MLGNKGMRSILTGSRTGVTMKPWVTPCVIQVIPEYLAAIIDASGIGAISQWVAESGEGILPTKATGSKKTGGAIRTTASKRQNIVRGGTINSDNDISGPAALY